MDVKRLMKHEVRTCRPHDSLNAAAQIMWEQACGSVPVVDGNSRPVGFLTDRDICMAAYTQGRPMHEITVETAMARKVVSCSSDDKLEHAAQLMRDNCLRRLPVVDSGGVLAYTLPRNVSPS